MWNNKQEKYSDKKESGYKKRPKHKKMEPYVREKAKTN